jgi:peptidoglycan/LPS O-acetylase OafA/YrhL
MDFVDRPMVMLNTEAPRRRGLMVLVFHFGTSLTISSFVQHALKTVRKIGWRRVDLFFVLSGFLITGILLDSRHADNYFASFYFRRALRIFPVYYLRSLFLFLGFPILTPGFERQEQSGQSVRAFCQQQGISEHSFYQWRKRLAEQVPMKFA